MKSGIIGTYFSTPSFYKKALRLALPICLQQALNQGASFLDTMMVSHVGGVGAVTVATQIDNLLMLVGFGVNSCILIFASQFFGAGNRRNLKRCFGLQLLLNVCIAGRHMVPVLLQRRRPAHRAGEAVHLHQRLFLLLHRAHQRVHVHVPQRADHEGAHAPRSGHQLPQRPAELSADLRKAGASRAGRAGRGHRHRHCHLLRAGGACDLRLCHPPAVPRLRRRAVPLAVHVPAPHISPHGPHGRQRDRVRSGRRHVPEGVRHAGHRHAGGLSGGL